MNEEELKATFAAGIAILDPILARNDLHFHTDSSKDSLDGFRHLFRDLDEHGSAFLAGSDEKFLALADRAAELQRAARRLPS